MHISILQPKDTARYRDLMLEAYELAADAFTSTADERAAEPESYWIKRIADPTGLSVAFGAFDGDALVGTVALEFSAKPKTKHKALIIGMYVKPEHRAKGLARALITAAITHAKSMQSIQSITLTVTEGNSSAIHLYQSVGFETYGVEPMAIHTPSGYKGKVLMWMPLRD
ncbi:MAG: GNAT family N-acetyltransferase [Betaproteobacteria bacterium]|nr:MAG: GNAT family N-acetyltransferase [Betaproteobacteria bacterium]